MTTDNTNVQALRRKLFGKFLDSASAANPLFIHAMLVNASNMALDDLAAAKQANQPLDLHALLGKCDEQNKHYSFNMSFDGSIAITSWHGNLPLLADTLAECIPLTNWMYTVTNMALCVDITNEDNDIIVRITFGLASGVAGG